MRDVSAKSSSLRTARAAATLKVSPKTVKAVRTNNLPKANPLEVAKIAGIQAAKNTSLLIPYCHQIPVDYVNVSIELKSSSISLSSEVKAIWKTGVEMEALVAVSSAALTLYDMLKPIDKSMEIVSVKLLEKRGGKSGIKETGAGLSAAVLVVSDSASRGNSKDVSGRFAVEKLKSFKFQVSRYKVIPDDRDGIERELRNLIDRQKVDLVITTGGTGVGPRDVTPEATLAVIDRRLDGIEQELRRYGQSRIPTAMLTRGIVGVRGKTLIINLPGSKGGVEDGLAALFPSVIHAFRMMGGEGH